MQETITIGGMSCEGCVRGVKRALGKLPLTSAAVEVGRARVEYDPARVGREAILGAIRDAGFEPQGSGEGKATGGA